MGILSRIGNAVAGGIILGPIGFVLGALEGGNNGGTYSRNETSDDEES